MIMDVVCDFCEKDTFWPNYFSSLEFYCDSIRKLASLPAQRGALCHNGVIEGGIKFRKIIIKEFGELLLAEPVEITGGGSAGFDIEQNT